MHLGLMSWSFFRSFANGGMDLGEMLQLASDLALDGVEIAPDHVPDWSDSCLKSLADDIHTHGLYVDLDDSTGLLYEAAASEEHRAHVEGMLKAADMLGAVNLREIVGIDRSGSKASVVSQLSAAKKHLHTLIPLCQEHGVRLCIENHGDITADELAALIDSADSEWVRCCLDTGNLAFLREDVVESTRLLAPYALTCHYSDTHIKGQPWGVIMECGPFGGGVCDLAAATRILADLAPDIHLNLEVATAQGDEIQQIKDAVHLARELISEAENTG